MKNYFIRLTRGGGPVAEWRWQMKALYNKKIVGASTETFKKRSTALDNLFIVTGWRPPIHSLTRGRLAYTWIVQLGGREVAQLAPGRATRE